MHRIAIEALGIHYYGGGRTATLTLLEALFALDNYNHYTVLLSQPEPSLAVSAGNVHQVVAPFKNRFLLRVWAQVALPGLTRGHDLIHFAKNLGVFGLAAPTVVTMYDLTTLVHPELFPRFDVLYWKYIQKRTLHAADRVISISKTTADDLVRFYDLPRERIQLIYPAYAAHFHPAEQSEIERVRAHYHLPGEYLIHVGHIDRKKNLTFLVEAFARFRRQSGRDTGLALVGEAYPKTMDLELQPTIERLGLKEHVRFTGKVPDADLPALYSGALAAAFPSLHEGFGLAPVEAMACGTPLIALGVGALPEVAGSGALLLDKAEVEGFAYAFQQVAEDAGLQAELRQRGLARARKFSGENTARQTLQLYEELIAKKKPH